MLQRLFVYGTLKDPRIQIDVIGREISGEPDYLCGYKLCVVKFGKEIYPAIKEDPESKKPVTGRVLLLTDEEMLKTDLYEGSYYQRKEVVLKSKVSAYTYVLNE